MFEECQEDRDTLRTVLKTLLCNMARTNKSNEDNKRNLIRGWQGCLLDFIGNSKKKESASRVKIAI